MISKPAITDEARLFAETIVDAWFGDGAARIGPATAMPFPSLESPNPAVSPRSGRCGLGKGIPDQVYH